MTGQRLLRLITYGLVAGALLAVLLNRPAHRHYHIRTLNLTAKPTED